MDATDYADAIATLADAQAYARELLGGVLYEHETAGVIADALFGSPPASPVEFATDPDVVSSLWTVSEALRLGIVTTGQWQDTADAWYELFPPATDDFAFQLASSIIKYQQDCRDNAKALDDLIEAAVSIDEVLQVDLSDGWPSREVTGGFTLPAGSDSNWNTNGTHITNTLTTAGTWYDIDGLGAGGAPGAGYLTPGVWAITAHQTFQGGSTNTLLTCGLHLVYDLYYYDGADWILDTSDAAIAAGEQWCPAVSGSLGVVNITLAGHIIVPATIEGSTEIACVVRVRGISNQNSTLTYTYLPSWGTINYAGRCDAIRLRLEP